MWAEILKILIDLSVSEPHKKLSRSFRWRAQKGRRVIRWLWYMPPPHSLKKLCYTKWRQCCFILYFHQHHCQCHPMALWTFWQPQNKRNSFPAHSCHPDHGDAATLAGEAIPGRRLQATPSRNFRL